MKFKRGFRLNANPNHAKDGKFTSKGGPGATGGGSGVVAGGPGQTSGKFAPGSPGDVVQKQLPGRKVLGVNERTFDADVLTEHKETFGGKTKTVKSTVQMLKNGDKWSIGDENASASVFKKNAGKVRGQVVDKGKKESIVRVPDGSYRLAPNSKIQKTVAGGPKMKFKY